MYIYIYSFMLYYQRASRPLCKIPPPAMARALAAALLAAADAEIRGWGWQVDPNLGLPKIRGLFLQVLTDKDSSNLRGLFRPLIFGSPEIRLLSDESCFKKFTA